MPKCNTTLLTFHDDLEDPLWNNGPRLHTLFIIIGGASCAISIVFTAYSSFGHALNYTHPSQQKCNLRILWMVPVYSTVSFLSILYPQNAAYFKVASDLYATIAVSSLFMLLTSYIAPNLHDAKQYFRTAHVENWQNSFPLMINWLQTCFRWPRLLRPPRSGLTLFNIIFFGIFQYNIVLIVSAIATLVTRATGLYCEISNHPSYGHFWVLLFDAISATFAMYCLDQYFFQFTGHLRASKFSRMVWARPDLKKWCVKIVLFFSTYQNLIISILTASWAPNKIKSIVHPSRAIAFPDLTIGIPNILLCVELAIISIVHLFAFPFRPYKKDNVSGHIFEFHRPAEYNAPRHAHLSKDPEPGGCLSAFAEALNPWDVVKAVARGFRWATVGAKHRHQDPSYANPVTGNRELDVLAAGDRASYRLDLDDADEDGYGNGRAVAGSHERFAERTRGGNSALEVYEGYELTVYEESGYEPAGHARSGYSSVGYAPNGYEPSEYESRSYEPRRNYTER